MTAEEERKLIVEAQKGNNEAMTAKAIKKDL